MGAGVAGQLRIRTVLANPRTSLRVVSDVEVAKTQPWSHAARVTTNTDDVVDDPTVQAVIVSTPSHLHEAVVIPALECGKHVLCEKPLATTPDACKRIVDTARRHARTLAVGFTHRYYPCFRFLRETLERGLIGTLDHVRIGGGHPGLSEFRSPWMYERATSGGGVMMDVGIHLTDLGGFLAGDITRVCGTVGQRIWEIEGSEDNAMAILYTASGVPIIYHANWAEWKGYRLCVDLYGSAGTVRGYYAPMFNLLAVRHADGRRRRRVKLYPVGNLRERLRGWQVTAQAACADELADFLRRLDGDSVPLATAEDGLKAVEVAAAVYESSRTRAPVDLVARSDDSP